MCVVNALGYSLSLAFCRKEAGVLDVLGSAML